MRDAAMARTLRRLAVEAGAAIVAVRGSDDLGAATKADASPVTRADLAADAVICAGLAAVWPGVPVVTEERPETHGLGGGGLCFLVDPLDGTKEFLRGSGAFTVNIALVEDGAPVAGVVYAPALGRLLRTAAGGGAVEERAGPDGFDPAAEGPIWSVRAARAEPGALRAVASLSHRDAETDAWLAARPGTQVVAAGSSLKFCLIAAGEADVYPRFGPTMHWDTAAGHALVEAAGGRVLRLPDGAPLRYPPGPIRMNPAFLACGPGVDPGVHAPPGDHAASPAAAG